MSTPPALSVLFGLALLGLFFTLSLYSRRRAVALLEENAQSAGSHSDRESFSDYYRPMTRMLDPREFEAARALAGVGSSEYARFRSTRIAAFRSYLNDMRLDFNRIEFKMRYLMLAASRDQADLVVSLNRVKSSFQLQMLRIEVQLFLFRFGWSSVDVQPLVQMLEQLEAPLLQRPSISAANV
jgi:hypothetical protein